MSSRYLAYSAPRVEDVKLHSPHCSQYDIHVFRLSISTEIVFGRVFSTPAIMRISFPVVHERTAKHFHPTDYFDYLLAKILES